MSQIRPLSYIEPSGGTVTPGSVLTLARGSRGLIGQWNAPVEEAVLDTEGTPLSVADMARAYNQLVWDFSRLGIVSTEPRMWFGDAGTTGLRFRIYDPTQGLYAETQYVPYPSPATPNTLALADVITGMNAAMGNTPNITLTYTDGSVSLLVKDGYSVKFLNTTPPGSYDTPLRIMRRLLLNVLGGLASSYAGPTLIQGATLPGPIAGLYPVPAAPGLLSTSEITDTSMRLSWMIPPQPPGVTNLRFNVFKDGVYTASVAGGVATYELTGLAAGQAYLLSVMSATDYEISVNNPEITAQTTGGVGPSPPVMILETGVGTTYNIEIPNPESSLSGVYLEVGLDKTGVPFSSPADTITMQVEYTTNPSDPSPIWIPYEGESLPPYYTPGIVYIPPTEPETKGTWVSEYQHFDTQPIRFYGLDPQIGYRVRSKYFFNNPQYGETAWSEFTPLIVSAAPTIQLTVGAATDETQLDISWSWPYPNMHNLTFYNVELILNPGAVDPGILSVVDNSGLGNSFLFSGLQSGSTYTVNGSLFYDAYYGRKLIQTLNQIEHQMAGTVIPIPDVSSVVGGETTISVAVNPPPPPPPTLDATIVGVYYDAEATSAIGEFTFGPSESPMVVTGMLPGQMFFVRARYRLPDMSLGDWSSIQSVVTIIPAPALSVGTVTSDSISVSWTPTPSGYIYHLRLTLVRLDGLVSDVVEIINDAVTTTSFVFEAGTVVASQQYKIIGTYSTDGITFESASTETDTIQTPSASAFGPITAGVGRGDGEAILAYNNSGYYSIIRFRVPTGSSYALDNKSFNKITFPLVDIGGGESAGVVAYLGYNVPPGVGFSVAVYDSSPIGGQLIAISSTQILNYTGDQSTEPTRWPAQVTCNIVDPVTYNPTTVSITEGMYIIFQTGGANTAKLYYRTFTNSPSIVPLVGIVADPTQEGVPTTYYDTTYGVCCEFDLV